MRRARKISICAWCRGASNFRSPPRRDRATRAPIPSWWRAIWRRWTRRSRDFNGTLFWSFLLLGLGLIGGHLPAGARSACCRCGACSDALARIRDGKARRLEGRFPAEIAPLATELNCLIEHSEEVVGRARTHVSNLAHFLKTPLSRCWPAKPKREPRSAGRAGASARSFTMRRQVDHYLARARAAGTLDVLGNRTQVAPVMDDLARVLRPHPCRARHRDRRGLSDPISISAASARTWKRWLGNLIDNACKWAKSRVRVRRQREGARLILTVEDDGPGLSAEAAAQVGERGERLDESVPGSGLGLAIVRDISKLYGGFFGLDA